MPKVVNSWLVAIVRGKGRDTRSSSKDNEWRQDFWGSKKIEEGKREPGTLREAASEAPSNSYRYPSRIAARI